MKTLAIPVPFGSQSTISVRRGAAIGGLALAINILSASTFPVFGKQLTGAFSPLSLLFVSEIMGGIFVVLSFGLLPLVRIVWKLKPKQLLYMSCSGLVTGVVCPYLWFMGLAETTAINAELFSRAEGIFLIALSTVLLKERMDRKQLGAISIILFGVAFVALKGFTVGFDMQNGDLLILGSSFLYAIGSIIVKKFLHDIHPEAIIFARAFFATTLFVVCTLFYTHTLKVELQNFDPSLIGVLLCYGFLTKFLGIYSFHEAIEQLKVSTVSMMGTLAIVGGMVFAAFYLGEHIHWYQAVGGGIIIFGVFLMQYLGVHSSDSAHDHHIRSHHRHHL